MPNSIQCSLTFLKTKGFLTVNLTFEQLKKRLRSTYKDMLKMTVSLMPGFAAPALSCNFEISLVNAVKSF